MRSELRNTTVLTGLLSNSTKGEQLVIPGPALRALIGVTFMTHCLFAITLTHR